MPSVMQRIGTPNAYHNLDNKYRSHLDHVDPELSKYNEVIRHKTVEEIYAEKLQPAFEAFNQRQKRKDRRLDVKWNCTDALGYQRALDKAAQESKNKIDQKGRPPIREIVWQIGNPEQGFGCKDQTAESRELAKELLMEVQSIAEERYPQLAFGDVVFHADEVSEDADGKVCGSFHLHASFVPLCYENKQGMDVQVAFERCLSEMKFNTFEAWKHDLDQIMESVLERHGMERTFMDNTEKHQSYTEFHRQQEVIKQTKELEAKKQEVIKQSKELEAAREDIQSFVDDMTAMQNDLTDKVNDLCFEAGLRQDEIAAAKKELSSLHDQKSRLDSEIEQKAAKVMKYEQIVEKKEQMAQKAALEARSAERTVDRVNDQKKALQAEFEALKGQVDGLREQKAVLQNEKSDLQAENSSLRNENAVLQEKVAAKTDLDNQINEAKVELRTMEKTLKEKDREGELAFGSMAAWKSQINATKKKEQEKDKIAILEVKLSIFEKFLNFAGVRELWNRFQRTLSFRDRAVLEKKKTENDRSGR